ncbi:MAG TPA: carbohydrate porin [Gemmataceae bacterium]|jgi:porin|nr:carbohydrate porin [Gemmataceae bacterium]
MNLGLTGREIRFGASAICWVVFAVAAVAQSESTATPQVEPPDVPARSRPGEYPEYLFREPFPAPVHEAGEDYGQKYLFGDWLGARSRLAEEGVRPQILLITDPFVNASGGRRRGFSEYDLLAVDLLLDTDKLLGWRGGEFHIGFANNSGTSLTEKYVGNNFPIQLADVASPEPRLTYLSYTQSLFDDKLSVRFGRLTINSVYGEEFAGSQYFKAFTSVAFDLVPLGIFLNAPGAFGYPLTTWGARVKFEPVESFYTMVGCYNGDPEGKAGDRHGADFTLRGPTFVIGEVGYRRNYGKDAEGLPGNLKLGAYFNGGDAPVFVSGSAGGSSATVLARYGVYAVADQALVRWGDPAEKRHLGAFGAFVCAPDQRVNPVPYFFDAGLVAYGFLPSRPRDFTAFGVAYGSYSGDLRRAEEVQALTNSAVGVQSREMTVELTYGCTVRPGLLVQPSLQCLINPGGNKSIPTALAVGVNVVLNF